MAELNLKTGTKSFKEWTRVDRILISNVYKEPSFIEMNIVNQVEDESGVTSSSQASTAREYYNDQTAQTTFNLLNPADNSVIGTMTYQQFYLAVYSLAIKFMEDKLAELAAQEQAAQGNG